VTVVDADGPVRAGGAAAGLALAWSGAPASPWPLTDACCAAIGRALLARGGPPAWESVAGGPAFAAWLSALRRDVPPADAERPGTLLRRCLVPADGAGASPAGRLLLDVVDGLVAGEDAAQRFDEAVAGARFEGLRELAYGASHEINNPLANIAARAQALLADERDPERRRRLATIVDQAFRARDMIGGLMLVARPPRPQPEDVRVDDLVAPVVESLRSQATARGVRLEYSPAPAPLSVRVDAAHVGEALRVIAVNAFEAVEDGGRVVVEAVRTGGEACEVVIGDDGRGMDAETARRACDPFFSGREAGRGIGLGLPKARRLVESSGGRLRIESRPGRGTRVTVMLPLTTGG